MSWTMTPGVYHAILCRLPILFLVSVLTNGSAAAQSQSQQPPAEVNQLMAGFAAAREFGDIEAVRDFVSPVELKTVRDTAVARYFTYKSTNFGGGISKDSPTLRSFVRTIISGQLSDGFVEAFARSFQRVETGQLGDEPALEFYKYLLQFPPSGIDVSASEFVLGRFSATSVVFYLRETWTAVLADLAVPKRFVVEWSLYPNGRWYLKSVR